MGDLVLPLASSLLMVAALYTVNMAYGYFVESRSKRLIARRFREYVPPEVVAKMERNPAQYDAPRDAELTILFADVRGFTGISESLAPGALREYINEYLTTMSEIVRARHRGTLDKYIGEKDRELRVAWRVVLRRIALHLRHHLGRHVFAEAPGDEALGARLHEVAVGHVDGIERGDHEQRARERQDEIAHLPRGDVEGDDRRRADGDRNARPQGGEHGNQEGKRNATGEEHHDLGALRVPRPALELLIEHAGDHVGVQLDAGQHIVHGRRAQVFECGRRGADQDDLVLQRARRDAILQHIR